MGGLPDDGVAHPAYLALGRYTVPALTVLFVTLACGAIGFTDDFIKLTHRRSLGLDGRWKLLLLGLITVGVGLAARHPHFPTNVFVPGIDASPALVRVVRRSLPRDRGRRERRNLTDGLDGLAAGTVTISLFTYHGDRRGRLDRPASPGTASPISTSRFSARPDRRRDRVPLVQRLPGPGLHGRHRLHGDRRSARRVRDHDEDELLLILIGGIFLIEALSVILQVFSFKHWQARSS